MAKKTPTTTQEYLDAIKARYDLPTDYRLAKFMGMSTQAISHYRHKGTTFSDEVALKVAELLELPEGKVLADMQAERARSERVKAAWREIARKLSQAAAFAGTVILTYSFTGVASHNAMLLKGFLAQFPAEKVNIMRTLRRWVAALFSRVDHLPAALPA